MKDYPSRCTIKNPFYVLSRLVLFSLLAALFPYAAYAQTSRGAVSGTVADSSGGVIPDSDVELTQIDTRVVRTTVTNDAGIYRFDAVDPGMYTIRIRCESFKPYVPGTFPVEANRTATIDAILEVGDIESDVEVSEIAVEASLVRDAPLRGGTLAGSELLRIPYGWLDPFFAGSYVGVAYSAITYSTVGGDFAVNGQRPRGNNFMLDGTDNNDVSFGGKFQDFRIIDAVQESSVQTGNFGVEFGRAGGGVFNLITRSGTNEFHGTLSWRLLSQAFDSMDNLRKLNTPADEKPKKPVYTHNIYGFTLGGPIMKNKTFFFGAFQQSSRRSTRSYAFVLPTEDAVDRLPALFPDNPRLDLYLNAIGGMRGEANPIDINLGIDPATSADRGTVQFATSYLSAPGGYDAPQLNFRLDHNLSDVHRISSRYIYDHEIPQQPYPVFPGYSYDYIFRRQNFLWSDSYALSPTWMNEFRFSYSRFAFDSAISDDSVPEAHTLPYLSIPNVSAPGMYTGIRNFQFANKWLFQETQTKLTGRHTLRYGFEFLRQLTKRRPAFNERGMLIYQNSVDPAYSAFANYLDDFSGPAGISAKNFGEPVFYPNQFRQSYFFQDSWKMAPSLTLTFGLRYENFGTPANIFEYPAFAGFDPSKFLEPNRVKPDNDNFGPAFGFAWSPGVKFGLLGKLFGDRRMVWRGGFQVSYDAFFDGMLLNIQSDAPNTVATTVVGSFLWRGTPDFFSTLPTDPRPVTPMDRQTSVLDPNIRSPYTERWSLGFQRQLPRGLAMDLSYVGSASHKLFTKEDLNARQLDGKRPHPDFGIRQIVAGSGNSNYHAMQLRVERRFATTLFLTGSYTWSRTIDSTSDISAGPSMNYEGSALTSVPAGQGGLRLDRALSDYHRSHLLVFVYSWDVPGPVNGFLGYLAGGWTLSGVSTFTSGAPYTARNGFDRNNDGISADRPDIGNPNAPLNTRAVISGGCPTGYLNPDTNVCVTPDDVHFVQGTGFPGSSTVGRNTLFTGGINQTWMNVMKMIPVAEGKKLEFRLEAMNVFNHASYANVPNASVVGSPGPAGGLPSRFLNRDYTLATNRAMNVQLKLVF